MGSAARLTGHSQCPTPSAISPPTSQPTRNQGPGQISACLCAPSRAIRDLWGREEAKPPDGPVFRADERFGLCGFKARPAVATASPPPADDEQDRAKEHPPSVTAPVTALPRPSSKPPRQRRASRCRCGQRQTRITNPICWIKCALRCVLSRAAILQRPAPRIDGRAATITRQRQRQLVEDPALCRLNRPRSPLKRTNNGTRAHPPSSPPPSPRQCE